MSKVGKRQRMYRAVLSRLFFARYREGDTELSFERNDILAAAEEQGFTPKNLGDVLYSARYRKAMPSEIIELAPPGKEWLLLGKGRGQYCFRLMSSVPITPNPTLARIKLPDATPEVIRAYKLNDEQALLAVVRYNRLVDVFLGVVTYSLQSHLRTTVSDLGQIEIDELYVGLDSKGLHYVMPVQAKSGSDRHSVVQTLQDMAYCKERFPLLRCRAISTAFVDDGVVAMFELIVDGGDVRIAEEKHYMLVPGEAAVEYNGGVFTSG